MKKLIGIGLVLSFVLACVSCVLYLSFHRGLYFSLAVTFFTTFYHFAMRIIVAIFVTYFRSGKTTEDGRPFQIGKHEAAFYKLIHIKTWKQNAPTYNQALFVVTRGSYTTLCHNMANAQIGHSYMVVFSFAPLLFSKAIDGFWPFFITSVLAALFDMQFVMIQRYNRARVSRIRSKMKERAVRLNRQQDGGETSSVLPV